ncbi:hypothetical protein [Flavobacterium selenitireducens]|uniref:hypothetical protein n=1 Tax=Flavobacterium selenitireducens TaxID=2722704 RepID=UPI00168ACCA4|nr:hypothetical protein [Flavobacterium selenitireducens]MBD3582888.1 hypothetical protein [Flavobacterium selenitireducens]
MDKNFEKELGRKLNERAITPSGNAWERVNLQRERQPKKNTAIYWIAAVLILGLGTTLLFNAGRQAEITHEVVEVKKIELETRSTKTTLEIIEPMEVATRPSDTEPKMIEQVPSTTAEPKQGVQETLTIASAELTRSPADKKITSKIPLTLESAKKTDPNDVDLLIEIARKEIAAGRGLSKPTDANALLKASESELDESFRSGIIENVFKQKRIRVAFGNN